MEDRLSEPLDQVYPVRRSRYFIHPSRRDVLKYGAGAAGIALLGDIPDSPQTARANQLAAFFIDIAAEVLVDVVKWFLVQLLEDAFKGVLADAMKSIREDKLREGGLPPERGAHFHNQYGARYLFPDDLIPSTKAKNGEFLSVDSYYRTSVDKHIPANRDWNGVELKRVKHYVEKQNLPYVLPFGYRSQPEPAHHGALNDFLQVPANKSLKDQLLRGNAQLSYVRTFQTPSIFDPGKQKTFLGCGLNYTNENGDKASHLLLI